MTGPKARPKPTPPPLVLDTNLVLSALVFSSGALIHLRRGWQSGRFTPLVSTATVGELIRVLVYPRFQLLTEERENFLSDYLPFCESIRVPSPPPSTPTCRDPFDVQFLDLAVAGEAEFIVTGDKDILVLASEFPCPILEADDFLSAARARMTTHGSQGDIHTDEGFTLSRSIPARER